MAVLVDHDHAPEQPAWTCSSCGKDWPCAPARERLARDYRDDPVALSVYMGAQLGLATFELDTAAVTSLELFDRFVAWPLALRVPLDRCLRLP